jgi:hypothetical protein
LLFAIILGGISWGLFGVFFIYRVIMSFSSIKTYFSDKYRLFKTKYCPQIDWGDK